MPAAITPDVEAIVGAYLRDAPAVAALVGTRVGGRTPKTTDEAWVRVTQYDDSPNPQSVALHHVIVHLQIDCYAGNDPSTGQGEASLLARTVRSVLTDLPGAHDEGVVSSVTFNGTQRAPDGVFTPARERFIVDVSVGVHP